MIFRPIKNRFERFKCLLGERETLKKALKNLSWLSFDRGIKIVIGFIVGVWLARYLGPEQYGLFNYSIALVSIFSVFSALGLERIIVRDLSDTQNDAGIILGSAFLLRIAGSFVTLFLSLVTIWFLRGAQSEILILVGLIAFAMFFQSTDVIDYWYQANLKSKYTVIAKNSAFIVLAFVKVMLIIYEFPLYAFALCVFFESALSAVLLVYIYIKSEDISPSFKYSLKKMTRLLAECWPLIFSGVALMIQARIDQVMLGQMIGDQEVGQYTVAMRLIETVAFVPVVIQMTAAPIISRAKLKGERLYNDRLLNLYRLMLIVFILMAMPIYLFSEQIILFFYGVDYQQAGILLSLFSIRLFFANFGLARTLFITNNSLFKYALYTAVAGTVMNVALNYALIPIYHSKGAILATIISFLVSIFIIDIFNAKTRYNVFLMLKGIASPWKFAV